MKILYFLRWKWHVSLMKMYFLECKCDIFLDDGFLFCETSPISRGVVQGWIKTGILKQIVLWWWPAVMQTMERAKTKKLEAITMIIIIIFHVVMVLHWRSKWATHTVAGCWLSLPMPCHHDCIPPVISKIYFITTVYHQPSQKDISSWLYTSHHLDIPVVVISSQLYTSCRYYIPTIYQL